MAKKSKSTQKVVKAELTEETAAAATIKSKTGVMAAMMGAIADMKTSDAIKFFEASMAQIGKEAEGVPSGAAAKNAASIAAKGAVKEDVAAMLEGEELSEEFRDRMTTLVESAVSARLAAQMVELEEKYDGVINEHLEILSEEIQRQNEIYIEYVAEEWVRQNAVAIESTLKTEIAESFIEDLKETFLRNYIDIPESKVDVVEALQAENDRLKSELNQHINEAVEAQEQYEDAAVVGAFETVSEGLAMSEVDRFMTLVEDIPYEGDITKYTKKLETIRDKYFDRHSEPVGSTGIVAEEVDHSWEDETTNAGRRRISDPTILAYVDSISRTAKK